MLGRQVMPLSAVVFLSCESSDCAPRDVPRSCCYAALHSLSGRFVLFMKGRLARSSMLPSKSKLGKLVISSSELCEVILVESLKITRNNGEFYTNKTLHRIKNSNNLTRETTLQLIKIQILTVQQLILSLSIKFAFVNSLDLDSDHNVWKIIQYACVRP